jgi:hypothetical protein
MTLSSSVRIRLWPQKLKKKQMKNFKTSELLILVITVVVIFVSEYHYMVEKDVNKAIFIGLWPPTILGLLNYVNSKTKK